MTHTPGPWNVSGILDAGWDHECVNADGPQAVARVHLPWIDTVTRQNAEKECAANAYLIAAAPTQHEALKRALVDVEDFADPNGKFRPTTYGLENLARDLRAAIALAKSPCA